MSRLPKILILWQLFIASKFPLDNAKAKMHNAEAKKEETIKAFESEDRKINFKCCTYREK